MLPITTTERCLGSKQDLLHAPMTDWAAVVEIPACHGIHTLFHRFFIVFCDAFVFSLK
jgi:hypothetical protein